VCEKTAKSQLVNVQQSS